MRPNEPSPDEALYECYECGERATDPGTDSCDACGGELRRISKARDL